MKASLLTVVEKVGSMVLSTVYFTLVLRTLGPSGFGLTSLAQSLAAFLGALTGGFEIALERFVPAYTINPETRGKVRPLVFMVFGFKAALGAVLWLGLYLAAEVVGRSYNYSGLSQLVRIAAPFMLISALNEASRSFLLGSQRYGTFAKLSLVKGTLELVVALVALFSGWHAPALLLKWVVAADAVALLINLVYCGRILARSALGRAPATGGAAVFREIMAFTLPVSGTKLLYMAYSQLGKLALGALVPLADLGYYSFALGTTERLMGVAGSATAGLVPWASEMVERGDEETVVVYQGLSLHTMLVVGGLAALAFLSAPKEIAMLLGGKEFVTGSVLLQIMAVQFVTRLPSQSFASLYYAWNRTRGLLLVNTVKTVVELALFVGLAWAFGAVGAVVAHSAAQLINYVVALLGVRSFVRLDARWYLEVLLRSSGAVLLAGLPGMLLTYTGWLPAFAPRLGVAAAAALCLLWLYCRFGVVRTEELNVLEQVEVGSPRVRRVRGWVLRWAHSWVAAS